MSGSYSKLGTVVLGLGLVHIFLTL